MYEKVSNVNSQINYNSVDLAKFLCAILVVSIHVAPFGMSDDKLLRLFNYGIQNCFSRIAVPIFFVASGFFLYRNTSLENFSMKPTEVYIFKLIRLYLIWTLIYSPFRIKLVMESKQGIVHGIFSYCRDIVFTGSYTHLWYFPALIFSVVLISYLLSRKIDIKRILAVALFFYVLGLFAQSWFGIIEPLKSNVPKVWLLLKCVKKIIVTTRDGLFDGFLFVGIGAFIAFEGFKVSRKYAFIGFISSYFLMFIEAWAVKYFGYARAWDMYIFLVPLTYFAFGLIINCHISGNVLVYNTLRVLSSLIFYMHLWVTWIINALFGLAGVEIDKTCLLFIFTVVISIVVSYMIYKLSEKFRFRWLRKLY